MSIILPAVVRTPTAHPERSERYAHVSTQAVIEAMAKEGFTVASVQTSGRRGEDALYGRHQVDFRHPMMGNLSAKDGYGRSVGVKGTVARLLFGNAHDGSTSARLTKGVWREVCSNGLVMPVEESVAIRHTGDAAAEVIRRAMSLAKNTAQTFQQIERWSNIETRKGERREFARLAAMLRWGDPHRFDLEDLLHVRREEDDRGDLWTVFNRVQENCVRGGIEGKSGTGRKATSRPLSEIEGSNNFNADLWTLASEFAEAHA